MKTTLRVGALVRSIKNNRRARITGLTITMVRLEYAPGRWQWRRIEDIERLYRAV